jgi:hypothetical protein
MANSKERRMNINWIVTNGYVLDPTINIDSIKNCGSIWGGWQTWRSCGTDNVICHDMTKASELVKRAFHATCNFYIPNNVYRDIGRPAGVKIYEGDFVHDVEDHAQIVAMHLTSSISDIVLLLGFDLSEPEKPSDKLASHRQHNQRSLIRQAIKDTPQVQWVVIDHTKEFGKDFLDLDNLTKDSMENVIGMLAN